MEKRIARKVTPDEDGMMLGKFLRFCMSLSKKEISRSKFLENGICVNGERKKVTAVIERANDGTYSIYMDADDMNYLVTGTGKTVNEAMSMFKGGYEDMRRYYVEEGKDFEEVDFDYKYDMASFLAYYSNILSLAGLSRLTGINQQQLSHYVTGRRHPSAKTVEKMQHAIQSFGNDLSSVRFV